MRTLNENELAQLAGGKEAPLSKNEAFIVGAFFGEVVAIVVFKTGIVGGIVGTIAGGILFSNLVA